MIVLKIIGYVLLGILALIVLALCVKVKIFAEYSEVDTHVHVKWLFLKFPLFPGMKIGKKGNNGKKKKNGSDSAESELSSADAEELTADANNAGAETQEQTESENTASTENQVKPKNNLLKILYDAHGIDGLLLLVNRTFSYLGTFVGDLSHSLVIEELYIDVKCNKNDAASTAIYYGEVCASLFPMLGALVSQYKVRKYDINVYPDYLARHSSASFAVSMHLYPIYLCGISFALVFKMLFKVLVRLIVKCFIPSKNKEKKKNNNTESNASVA